MKHLFSLAAVLLMAGTMLAQEVTFDLSNAANDWGFPTAYYNRDTTYTNGTYSIQMLKGSDGSGWKVQGSAILFGKNGAALRLPAFDFAVAKIEVVGAEGASGKVTFNIFSGTTAVSTAVTGATGTATFLIASANQAAGTIYTIKNTNSNNNQISQIKIYKAVAGAPEAPTIDLVSGTYISAQQVTLACVTAGAEIRYTTDGSEPTAASTLYSAPLTISETTTLKAVAVKNNVLSSVVSASYIFVSPEGQGTQDNPFTIADVILLNNGYKDTVWVEGTIVGTYCNNAVTPVTDTIAASNVAIATGNDTIPVELPSGSIRTAVSLKNHIENLGATLKVRGVLVAYIGRTGVKSPKAYELIPAASPVENVATEQKAYKFIQNGVIYIRRGDRVFTALGTPVE